MRDVLTEEECRELIAPHLPGGVVSSQAMRIMFQAAARLGAERERESLRDPTEEMIDAPRQIILYAETPGRTLEGLRAHLVAAGVDYLAWAPVWATRETGHLTKGAIAILVWHCMFAEAIRRGEEG